MVFSDEYIKMVRALPEEFFKDWKWEVGDRGLITWPDFEDNEILITDITSRRFEFRCVVSGHLEIGFDSKGIRPLPSQKQLQEMCLEEGGGVDPELLYVFFNWIYSPLRKVVFNSMESAWLQFVMWSFHKKTWNGDQWI